MAKQQLVREERSSYKVLLFRKSKRMRLFESLIFLLGLGAVWLSCPPRSSGFIMGLVADILITLFLPPAIYLFLFRPHYLLFPDRLEICWGKRKKVLPLRDLEQEFGLPYVYLFGSRKIAILVSDAFLGALNGQLEVVKRGLL
ncbi:MULTISPECIES: hypothetical protein [Thermoactinomyces]|jgi:hypothetical protein|uniref:Uncharacterized protein n=1 Tax=Thermoactinomyces daqus TaxID=1329516 RepID=A0A7W1XCP0_9BACL|nr:MULTISPECIES: hypothetical protein [Thermoactinomyces]MBA4544134.1 hypothetical protein [Thermoactinomyces daqus]MBH8599522.1 hypothetical protein [Thermoactinomyces sp. CICC 10523]MBH8605441.1 hypothetical protein [Thermoactinomyces sp. CICC 10522]MBH8608965.1 hypothetical protein [Thermoactinomyces sp. CICC 10521]